MDRGIERNPAAHRGASNGLRIGVATALALEAALRLRGAAVSGSLGERLAPAVRGSSLQLLERLLDTPARRVVLDAFFWQMPRYIHPERNHAINSSVQWRVTGRADGTADEYRLEIADGQCRVRRGTDGPPPALTITLDATELVRLVSRRSDPLAAYFTGRVTITGNVMAAAKFGALFLGLPSPSPSPQG